MYLKQEIKGIFFQVANRENMEGDCGESYEGCTGTSYSLCELTG